MEGCHADRYDGCMRKKRAPLLQYLAKNIFTVVGLVLIWRGIWYVLDYVDQLLFSSQHLVTALGGIAAGLLILYIPDKDLKEIEKL